MIKKAVAGCDGVLTVLAPWGVDQYSSGTAQAVLDHAGPGARLVFSCGWHITRDGLDVYSWKVTALVKVVGRLARLARIVELDDQVEACQRIFASDTRWTVVRGSDLEEGKVKACPCGASTSAIPSSQVTSRAAWTLPCSSHNTEEGVISGLLIRDIKPELLTIERKRCCAVMHDSGRYATSAVGLAGRPTISWAGTSGRIDNSWRSDASWRSSAPSPGCRDAA